MYHAQGRHVASILRGVTNPTFQSLDWEGMLSKFWTLELLDEDLNMSWVRTEAVFKYNYIRHCPLAKPGVLKTMQTCKCFSMKTYCHHVYPNPLNFKRSKWFWRLLTYSCCTWCIHSMKSELQAHFSGLKAALLRTRTKWSLLHFLRRVSLD